MKSVKIGDRVFAVLSANKDEVNLLGHGEYLGARPIAEADEDVIGLFGIPVKEILEFSPDHTNPCIKLDDGNIIWGFECWWGPESKYEEMIGNRKIVNVSIKEARKRNT